jgi:outer membrane scaffolding protein for murein synthesis (MipA/OmpV family)
MRKSFLRSSLLLVFVSAGVGFPMTPMAQDRYQNRPAPEWDVTLGAGAAVRPTFEGSDRYIVSPVPFVNITWRDMISLGADGLSAYWRHDNFRIGGALTYNIGRQQSSGAFRQGDDRLYGLGDVPAALGVKGFADYTLGFVNLNASVTKFTATGNDGVLVNFGVAVPYKLTDSLSVSARVSANWADQDYEQTFFGITPTQSANTGYSQYSPSAGIKDVNFGVGARYRFNEHWLLAVDARLTQLTGDAANSPIVYSKTGATFFSAIAYHF